MNDFAPDTGLVSGAVCLYTLKVNKQNWYDLPIIIFLLRDS